MTIRAELSLSVYPEMVDFVPRQGRPREICFAFHRARRRSSATLRIETCGERRIGAKYAVSGWTLLILYDKHGEVIWLFAHHFLDIGYNSFIRLATACRIDIFKITVGF